jgi:hypothetical protein
LSTLILPSAEADHDLLMTCIKHEYKKLQSTFKKVVIGRAVTALKQQKSKGKGEEKGIAEIVHLMKPTTRSPDSSSSSSSSSSSNNNNNNNNNNILSFSCFALATAVPKGLERLEENIDKCYYYYKQAFIALQKAMYVNNYIKETN